MKSFNTLLFFFFLSQCAFAQLLLGSAGSSTQNSSYQLQWSMGESIIGGFNNSAHFISVGYQQPITIEVVGLEEPEVLKGISLYPNPFIEYIYLEISESIVNDYKLRIIEPNGKPLDTKVEDDGKRLRIDATKWASGVYLLKIECDRQSFVAKIIKH
jgi:hypothetical protein